MEPFAQAVAFSSKEYVSGRVIDVHGLLLDGHWVGTYIGDEQSTKSEIQEINDIVALREKALLDKHTARIADLERVLKDTCELMDKCAGRLNVFVAQHVGSGDEYFVFELNRLSVCAGALDAMSRKALSEIKSVLGKGE